MNINVLFGLLAAVALVIAGAIFADLVGRLTLGFGFLYCPAEGDCVGYVFGRGVLFFCALLVAFIFVKLIDE